MKNKIQCDRCKKIADMRMIESGNKFTNPVGWNCLGYYMKKPGLDLCPDCCRIYNRYVVPDKMLVWDKYRPLKEELDRREYAEIAAIEEVFLANIGTRK